MVPLKMFGRSVTTSLRMISLYFSPYGRCSNPVHLILLKSSSSSARSSLLPEYWASPFSRTTARISVGVPLLYPETLTWKIFSRKDRLGSSDRSENTVLTHYCAENDLHKCGEKSDIVSPFIFGIGSPLDWYGIPNLLPCTWPVLGFQPNGCDPIRSLGYPISVCQFARIRLGRLPGWPFPNS